MKISFRLVIITALVLGCCISCEKNERNKWELYSIGELYKAPPADIQTRWVRMKELEKRVFQTLK